MGIINGNYSKYAILQVLINNNHIVSISYMYIYIYIYIYTGWWLLMGINDGTSCNVVNTIKKPPIWEWLYHLCMVIWGWFMIVLPTLSGWWFEPL